MSRLAVKARELREGDIVFDLPSVSEVVESVEVGDGWVSVDFGEYSAGYLPDALVRIDRRAR